MSKNTKSALTRLTPNAIDVKIDGQDVRVATSKEENAIMNMILASQGRDLIQRALKHWKDLDEMPTPKELRDIAGAMRDIASFSAEVYASAEPLNEKTAGEKQAERTDVTDVDFSDLGKIPEVKETKPNEEVKETKEDRTGSDMAK